MGAMFDLLARSGHLEKAFDVVKKMPIEPDAAIWRALLSGCRTHRNISLGEQILNHVRQLGSSGQVLLSSLYAYMGNWESAVTMRKLMGGRRNTSEVVVVGLWMVLLMSSVWTIIYIPEFWKFGKNLMKFWRRQSWEDISLIQAKSHLT